MANTIDFRFQEMLNGISEELKQMDRAIGESRKPLLKSIGQKVKKAVQTQANRAEYDYNRHNYDGSEPYKHVKDDIAVTVTDSGVTVRGGKKTGYKWHILNDGHLDGSRFVAGSHFVDNAISQATPEIDQLVDETVRRLSNGGKA